MNRANSGGKARVGISRDIRDHRGVEWDDHRRLKIAKERLPRIVKFEPLPFQLSHLILPYKLFPRPFKTPLLSQFVTNSPLIFSWLNDFESFLRSPPPCD